MRAIAATMRAAFAEAAANRRALVFQMTVMILNDAVWIAFWAIFFDASGNVQGWDLHRLLLLQATLTTAGGISLGLLNNARQIGALATSGGIDAALALPTRPLAHLLVRRVEAVNLGDVVFGVVLFAIAGEPTLERTALFIVVVLAGASLLTAFLVLVGSLAFFAGRNDAGELGFHAMLLLCAYPLEWFGGIWRVLMFTVIPAVFVAGVPARVVDELDWRGAGVVVGVAALFSALAALMFQSGLRRYTSGSVWTRA
jgi:ABC-2 type transport system permease protein